MKYITPNWPAPKHIQAFSTTRYGYDGGSLTDRDITEKNNHHFKTLFNLPCEPIWLKQTHSNIVVEATVNNLLVEADASFATHAKQIAVVSTADCLPILITNQTGTAVAAIHAGWRGLANGIIQQTFKKLANANSPWLVWLAPAISQSYYEVGKDVYDAFMRLNPDNHVAFKKRNPHKWLADLYELARIQLRHLGITNIYGGEYCTYSQADLFFSYRRDQGHAGRMVSLIWITG